jgi:hypothetical protein
MSERGNLEKYRSQFQREKRLGSEKIVKRKSEERENINKKTENGKYYIGCTGILVLFTP